MVTAESFSRFEAKFEKNLSPKPVDKFVDNVKKNFMPY